MVEGEFSGKRWNRIIDEMTGSPDGEYREMVRFLIDLQTADGPPLGYGERSDYSQLQELRALRAGNSDAYWNDAKAQQRLQVLEQRYAAA